MTHPALIKFKSEKDVLHELWTFYIVIILKELIFYFCLSLQKVRKTKLSLPQMKIYQNPFRFDEHCVPKKIFFLHFLNKKIISFLQNGQYVAQTLISCFAKSWYFHQNFDFAKFEGNFAKQENFAKLRKRKFSQPPL